MTITEKVSYIKGLLEGLNLDENKPEVKVLTAVVDLLDDISLEVTDIEEGLDEFVEQVDEIDEDLSVLEDDFYGSEDDEEDDEDLFYEVTCPTCGETVCLSESVLLDGEVDCPKCGENLEFDFDELCDCDNEGCSCQSCNSLDSK
ncbi:MAG: hypothetical protein RUMPE_00565 [Eubacteriales bacterium SKADARSKE-1]|nr:hypothetical protein [Eubacteriales bacterium SKADARSKE-1]